jgi:hypothetical protein
MGRKPVVPGNKPRLYWGTQPQLSNNKELTLHSRPQSNHTLSRMAFHTIAYKSKEPPSTATITPANIAIMQLLIRGRRAIFITFGGSCLSGLATTQHFYCSEWELALTAPPFHLPLAGGFSFFHQLRTGRNTSRKRMDYLRNPSLVDSARLPNLRGKNPALRSNRPT